MDYSQGMITLLTAINQVGFPIFLTCYLLFRFEKKIEILSDSISKLYKAINKHLGDDENER